MLIYLTVILEKYIQMIEPAKALSFFTFAKNTVPLMKGSDIK